MMVTKTRTRNVFNKGNTTYIKKDDGYVFYKEAGVQSQTITANTLGVPINTIAIVASLEILEYDPQRWVSIGPNIKRSRSVIVNANRMVKNVSRGICECGRTNGSIYYHTENPNLHVTLKVIGYYLNSEPSQKKHIL